jgi:hypothetical protein
VIYACQQYIPNVLRPFSGYFNNFEVSIIISWGRPEWESQILYIKDLEEIIINLFLLCFWN